MGNSSSGISEVPFFGIGTINLGDRQAGRIFTPSILNTKINSLSIKNSLKKTKRLLVCQEAPSNSSVGTTVISKIVESELFHELEVAPKLVSGLHSPMPSAKHLELNVIPQTEDIINAVKSML